MVKKMICHFYLVKLEGLIFMDVGWKGRRSIQKIQFSGSSDGLSAVLNLQLAEDFVEVLFHGAQSDEQRFGDLAVG